MAFAAERAFDPMEDLDGTVLLRFDCPKVPAGDACHTGEHVQECPNPNHIEIDARRQLSRCQCNSGIRRQHLSDVAKREPIETPESEGPFTRERLRVIVLMVLTGVAIALTIWVVTPFIPALAWALAFAVVGWPVHQWINARVKWPSVAAFLSVTFVTIVLVVPLAFVTHQALSQLKDAFPNIKNEGDPKGIIKKLEDVPKIGGIARWAQRNFNIREQGEKLAESVARRMPNLIGGSFYAFLQMAVALFTLFFFFRDRQQFLSKATRMSPLAPREMNRLISSIRDTVRASILGNVVVSLIQAALNTLMFWWLGFEAPVLWGVAVFFLSLIPTLGAPVIWAPAALYLASSGEMGKAALLTAWGVGVVGTIDNILYPILTGKKMRMHTLPIFFAVIGGIFVFGASGLVLGPVVFAVTLALIDIWKMRTEDDQSADEALKAA